MRAALWGLIAGLLLSGVARAHPLAPALLERALHDQALAPHGLLS